MNNSLAVSLPAYSLRLYITGTTLHSVRAISNIKMLCETHLKGRYELEIIDIYQHPLRAREDQIVAAPTLIRIMPMPPRTFVGDLSDTARVLRGLDVHVD